MSSASSPDDADYLRVAAALREALVSCADKQALRGRPHRIGLADGSAVAMTLERPSIERVLADAGNWHGLAGLVLNAMTEMFCDDNYGFNAELSPQADLASAIRTSEPLREAVLSRVVEECYAFMRIPVGTIIIFRHV
jgi:hypothetical protein